MRGAVWCPEAGGKLLTLSFQSVIMVSPWSHREQNLLPVNLCGRVSVEVKMLGGLCYIIYSIAYIVAEWYFDG